MKIIQKLKTRQTLLTVILLLVLMVPSFYRMLKLGLWSMHDFHIFRLFEYNRCYQDLQIPCRWSPDVSFEYGQPLFNFYGQLSYFYGMLFHWIGFSLIDSEKIIFLSSLVLSGLAMFILAKNLWKNNWSALISACVYVYAPYRAVDVWVRGAMPEAFAFIFFPLIVYFFNQAVETKKKIYIWWFGLSFGGLVLTHNLSALMFMFFFVPWAVYYFIKYKAYRLFYYFLFVTIVTVGLTSFYLLPLIGENSFVSLQYTTQGYFTYFIHFDTVKQIFLSNFWGYGGSTWGADDGLSLAVGYIQWILPLLLLPIVLWKRHKLSQKWLDFIVLILLGFFMLMLTHNKSMLIWEHLPPLQYVQFPWRFLGLGEFALALCAGIVALIFKKPIFQFAVIATIITLVISLNFSFYFEDLWFHFTDSQQFNTYQFGLLIPSSVGDYWPVFGKSLPNKKAPDDPIVATGSAAAKTLSKTSKNAKYAISVSSNQAVIQAPIVYFPGWVAKLDQKTVDTYPSPELGLVSVLVPNGNHILDLEFTNTPIRSQGNTISLVSILIFVGSYWIVRKKDEKKN